MVIRARGGGVGDNSEPARLRRGTTTHGRRPCHWRLDARDALSYRPGLDGVRALAIALVVGRHAFHWPREGDLGVDLFFVLSGFLITTLLLEEHGPGGRVSLRAFYGRRVRRLMPALVAMLTVYTFVVAVQGRLDAMRTVRIWETAGYVTNIAYLWGGQTDAGLNHLWS